tara:strand:+ start:9504 stop:9743 length:240 start_codon:yes stop_codon:yes gene_type:complete
MSYQFIDHGDQKLLIKRTFKEYQLKPQFNVDVLNKWLGTDIILRKNGIFYCCETIQDATIIEPEEVPVLTQNSGSTQPS